MPDLKKYQNAFKFLQDCYSERKAADSDFSYEVWAKELSFANRSYLRFVVLGKRPISENLLQAFLRNFQLEGDYAEYFSALVHYTQSKSADQRKVFGRQLIALSEPQADRLEVEKHFEFLSDHTLPCLQTICGFQDAPREPGKLSQLLGLSEKEMVQKLELLEDLGLVKNYVLTNRSWMVPAAYQALGHKEFYRETLKKAEDAMELPFDLRKFRSLFVAMNPEEFVDFQKDFEIFVREQLGKRDAKELSGRRLYQLNFNFFPTSESL